jgi:cyclopropane-fatty-acyl-phospholipid synthase
MSQYDDFSRASIAGSGDMGKSGIGARLLARLLRDVRYGRLKVTLPSGISVDAIGSEPGPDAAIVMKRWRTLRRVLTGGDIGFAEGFIDEDWTTPDLVALIRFGAQNRESLAPAIGGSLPMRIIHRVRHMLNANTRRGSRRNIEAHYDLGNDFYKEWLDASMLYSSALFDETTPTLEAAQDRKLERIREKLDLAGGESVLEIGSGWGALAVHLATAADSQVTGITLSPSQLGWSRDLAARQGRADQAQFRLQDYRDTGGRFDRIVSIEMFEAVGEGYWPDYFQALKRCLKPGGKALLQIISIEEQRFDDYRRNSDFIQKYIFPGGFLPSDSALATEIERNGLSLVDIEHFGKSYARTLMEWRARFHVRWPAIAALGFDARFRRLWDYYLCYCAAGFEQGAINVGFYMVEHDGRDDA